MYRLATTAALLLALATPGTAAAAGWHDNTRAEQLAAPAAHGVVVECSGLTTWSTLTNGDASIAGLTFQPDADHPAATIYLAPDVCYDLDQLGHPRGSAYDEGSSLMILAHETQHARGVLDEAQAECRAWRGVRSWIARAGLRGRSARVALHGARDTHESTPASYRADC